MTSGVPVTRPHKHLQEGCKDFRKGNGDIVVPDPYHVSCPACIVRMADDRVKKNAVQAPS